MVLENLTWNEIIKSEKKLFFLELVSFLQEIYLYMMIGICIQNI